ncbi:HSP70-domain-containing protein [Gonapodya prolifera JEL478]|uniref:HSP70-domain-containing protein n=1 Tax=Gonapodya prolifera (strain JEL478) TaxID=1344416 RepID=A0A139A8N0_GONPJ|nr:HSP70-domain-containing protein [Gonapodya prolifera JEL478]|eukprot:KXS13059.1 HSP70-domain-containing protein [Gonapodya prolifera JEL478]
MALTCSHGRPKLSASTVFVAALVLFTYRSASCSYYRKSAGPIVGIDIGSSQTRIGLCQSGCMNISILKVDTTENRTWNVDRLGRADPATEESVLNHAIIHAFERAKEAAKSNWQLNVTHAVLTVPAYSTDNQRQMMKTAGESAGIQVERIINAPTAASIAYELDKRSGDEKILVIDFGVGLDLTVLEIDEGVFDLIRTSEVHSIGGDAITSSLVDLFLQELRLHHQLVHSDPATIDSETLTRLWTAAEEAKHNLSHVTITLVEIPSLFDGEDFRLTVTRDVFEDRLKPLLEQFVVEIDKMLHKANLTRAEVHAVVLTGGSTRIPKVVETVQGVFVKGRKIVTSIDPDEAVVRGAAIQGSILVSDDYYPTCGIFDATLWTLSVEIDGGLVVPIIPRNSYSPTKRSTLLTTVNSAQRSARVRVYGGERASASDNTFVGELELWGFASPSDAEQSTIEVTFIIHVNDSLEVTAVELQSGVSNSTLFKMEQWAPFTEDFNFEERFHISEVDEERDRNLLKRFADTPWRLPSADLTSSMEHDVHSSETYPQTSADDTTDPTRGREVSPQSRRALVPKGKVITHPSPTNPAREVIVANRNEL